MGQSYHASCSLDLVDYSESLPPQIVTLLIALLLVGGKDAQQEEHHGVMQIHKQQMLLVKHTYTSDGGAVALIC